MEEKIKQVAEAPSLALNHTIDTSQKIAGHITKEKHIKGARNYWHILGPGLTTGAADDDPSGIATYSQTGSRYGFQLLWLSVFTLPLMSIVQEMCARIGLVTGRGLAGNIRLHYPKKILYVVSALLFFANVLNIGADLGAMAKAVELLVPQLNFNVLIIGFAVLSLYLQIFINYGRYAKYLKWLALVLLTYIFSAFSLHLDWPNILRHAVIPSITFSKDQIFLICAILGTTISPYLFFWQTSQEVEEMILSGKTSLRLREGTNKREVRRMRIDVWTGMFLSDLVMFFIIATCAATLFAHGIINITTSEQAARALRPIAGENAYLLFAIGIIGTGLLAIPVLTGSASYAISESLKWPHGLYRKLKAAPSFYGIIIISMLIGLGINFLGIDPIKALIYSAVANGLIAPVILVLIVKLSSSKKVMGNWANSWLIEAFGWYIVILMTVVGLAAIYSLL